MKTKDWVLDKLSHEVKRAVREIGMEGKRLGIQGATELAAGLNQGNGFFVPYGAGQDIQRFDKSRGRDM